MERTERREVYYDGVHCNLAIQQFRSGVVVLKISGNDVGEFGDAPMVALSGWLDGRAPVEFFIDAHEVRGASIEVSGDWAQWLGKHRAQLRTITMLTGSHFIRITAEFVRRFADLEGIMRICTEPGVFDRELKEALGNPDHK
ncbi:MAG TPA: hypothetical protein VKU01_26840 [Bryobacteraceae bacterium]|nr:hypothetical protein [Bryobacteraceae bacterium]